jgi:hypothetical protein
VAKYFTVLSWVLITMLISANAFSASHPIENYKLGFNTKSAAQSDDRLPKQALASTPSKIWQMLSGLLSRSDERGHFSISPEVVNFYDHDKTLEASRTELTLNDLSRVNGLAVTFSSNL